MKVIPVIPASEGISMGAVRIYCENKIEISSDELKVEEIERELERLERTLSDYVEELRRASGEETTLQEIRNAHISMVEDPYFQSMLRECIRDQRMTLEQAITKTIRSLAQELASSSNERTRDRAGDYEDIRIGLLHQISGIRRRDFSDVGQQEIVFVDELSVSDICSIRPGQIRGIVSQRGGVTGHAFLMAQTMGIPAVIGITERDFPDEGALVIVDAISGKLIVDPDEDTLKKYRLKLEDDEGEVENRRPSPVTTACGNRTVDIYANVVDETQIRKALQYGALGVGLYRTEFFFMTRAFFPTEEEQFQQYRRLAETAKGRPFTIRTLDVGADKQLPFYPMEEERNPELGKRGIRVSLDDQEIFKTQMRAILRASAYGKIRILLPMVIDVSEILAARRILEEIKEQLRKERIEFDEKIALGIMIETPASVWMADAWVSHADFFSIGTNDLTQYTLCVDRDNKTLQQLYRETHPAVLRSIHRVVEITRDSGKTVAVCGGMAGESNVTELLLGLGIDEFSVPVGKVKELRDTLSRTRYPDAVALAKESLSCASAEEVKELLDGAQKIKLSNS